MRFFQTLLTGAALVATALSLTIDTYPPSVEAGKTYTIEYSPKDDTPTTFVLRKGLSTNLDTVETLTTTATGGTFTWTVKSTYTDGTDYALEIKRDGSAPNYSGQFPLTGGSGSVSSAVSSALSSARASASSALSSAVSSALSSARSASATVSPSAGTNSTVTSATLSRTASGTSRPTGTSTGGVPESTGAASSLATSPLAALFGAIAAFAYLA